MAPAAIRGIFRPPSCRRSEATERSPRATRGSRRVSCAVVLGLRFSCLFCRLIGVYAAVSGHASPRTSLGFVLVGHFSSSVCDRVLRLPAAVAFGTGLGRGLAPFEDGDLKSVALRRWFRYWQRLSRFRSDGSWRCERNRLLLDRSLPVAKRETSSTQSVMNLDRWDRRQGVAA